MDLTEGWPASMAAFSAPGWRGRMDAAAFATVPYRYPGRRPTGSFAVSDSTVWGLDPSGDGWVDRDDGTPVDLSGRALVLAYGSNADPQKLGDRIDGVVLVLRVAVLDHAAVWCNARRSSDRAVVATIVPDPGRIEVHHVLALTPAQLDTVDRWEGAPDFYERQVHAAPVLAETGTLLAEVLVYVGTPQRRPPLLVDGVPLRLAEHGHDDVDPLVAK